ncbi:hypothetical protein CW752_16465 [Chryseobacterium sp. PMSZPI]|nr:hypothetical protein CW752_16465 [Chryseobacterium sp. PMSZPI]
MNTPTPKATFDITAKASRGTAITAEGLLVPRVDRQRAQSMTGVVTSTLIYVDSVTTGTQTGTAAQIDAVGYYYFNGTSWVKLIAAAPASVNIYNNNGTLTDNRTVQQAGNTLAFTSTATTGTNHFSVDGSTFSVDAVNNRVGMGTTAPQNRLDLGSTAGSSATDVNGKKLAVYNNATGSSFYGLGVHSNTLQIHAASTATAAPGMVLTNTGRVGIGDPAPVANFDLVGNTFGIKNSTGSGSWDNLWFNVTAQGATINASGAESGMQFRVGKNTAGTYGDSQTLTTVATMMPDGNMGIGNTTPGERLSVVDGGNANQYSGIAAFEANNRTQGVGIGWAGIQSIGTNGSVALNLNAKGSGNIIMQTQSTGNVGIGTASPNANALLDLTSTTRGFLPPRMTTAQRDAITTRPAGLMVYNSSTARLEYFNGTAWVAF